VSCCCLQLNLGNCGDGEAAKLVEDARLAVYEMCLLLGFSPWLLDEAHEVRGEQGVGAGTET